MKYSEAYQRTRDIDWFFVANNQIIHVASNGGKLPEFVNDLYRLREEQSNVALLKSFADIPLWINVDYVINRVKKNIQQHNLDESEDSFRNDYLKSFEEMARKGFYSYDRDLDDENRYVLICRLENPPERQIEISLPKANNEIEFEDDNLMSFRVKTKYSEDV